MSEYFVLQVRECILKSILAGHVIIIGRLIASSTDADLLQLRIRHAGTFVTSRVTRVRLSVIGISSKNLEAWDVET